MGVGLGLCGRVPEGLGLDRPHHDACTLQRRARFGQGVNAVVGAQRRARLRPGLHHIHQAGGMPLLDQPANDGAGHVAASNESDGGKGGDSVVHGGAVR